MRNILVSDLMTREPISVSPSTNVLDCIKKMISKKVGSLLIVENKRLVGLITERDVLWAMTKKPKDQLSDVKAIDISPKKIPVVKPNFTVKEAIQKMKKVKSGRLPVIHNSVLVGIITWRDILNFNPAFYKEYEEIDSIREKSNKIKRFNQAKKREPFEGICENCGKRDLLKRFNGMLICEECEGFL